MVAAQQEMPMRRYIYETRCSTDPNRLYRAITDIRRWPEWGSDLEWAKIETSAATGASFTLKPKGGPKVAMLIEEAEAPRCFTDLAKLPLARMRTRHEFTSTGRETLITIVIEVFGPLSFLWDRIVARQQAADTPEQTQRLIAFAEALR
jgi:hypothetical protein